MQICESMDIMDKLAILTDAAKYDVACTSSGTERKNNGKGIGNTARSGICHSFSADGRCISLLKILMSNECVFDCRYCINRKSNDVVRTTFTPDEICTLTMDFYKRNYIEGLFLSSGIINNPTYTMMLLCETVRRLREVYRFGGYIHVKGIPGADPSVVERTGWYADRMSVNLEFPTTEGLKSLAPNKTRNTILSPMKLIRNGINNDRHDIVPYNRSGRKFVPAGQSTQMVIGASGENDYQIINVSEALYKNYGLKRVFYSAFVNVNNDSTLPSALNGPPLLREHRLYQADWLMRFYGFKAQDILSETRPDFNVLVDPKCDWALRHLEYFPVEINRADYYSLLKVPGIGVNSAKRIIAARRSSRLDFADLKRIGVVLKRAIYFITCNGIMMYKNIRIEENYIVRNILDSSVRRVTGDDITYRQLSFFDTNSDIFPDEVKDLTSYGIITGQI